MSSAWPQLARDDFALEAHLRGVVDMLPVASAASRQKRARRDAAVGARADDLANLCDRVIAALRNDRDIEHVARHRVRNHHGLAVDAADAERPERHRIDFDFRHSKQSLSAAYEHLRDATYNDARASGRAITTAL